MEPTTGALITAIGSGSGGLIGGILLVLIIGIPAVIRFIGWSKEQNTQITLYTQLAEQVQRQTTELEKQRSEIDRIQQQRNELHEKVAELKGKIEHLEHYEKDIVVLKEKIEEKDRIIAERDSRIANLLRELLVMKDRVHNLELRLKDDEQKFCVECKHRETK
jgi:predicted RNase H-like nuclease (RuvC/YqgF family)